MDKLDNTMIWEEAAIPLTKGVDLNTRARLVEPSRLLSAKNAFFPRAGGPEKRRGHIADRVLDSEMLRSVAGPEPEDYLYGWGLYDTENLNQMSATNPAQESPYTGSGVLRNINLRDNEEVVCDDHRLYSNTQSGWIRPNQNEVIATANKHWYHPSFSSSTIGKTQNAQAKSSLADTGVIKVVSFVDTRNEAVRIKCYDSVTGASKFDGVMVTGGTDPDQIRVVVVGQYIHVYTSDSVLQELFYVVIKDSSLSVPTVESLGECYRGWDTAVTANSCLVVKLKIIGTCQGAYIADVGGFNTTYVSSFTGITLDQAAIAVACAIHPVSGEICVSWNEASAQKSCVYSASFTALNSLIALDNETDSVKTTCTSSYLLDTVGRSVFYVYYDDSDAVTSRFSVKCWIVTHIDSTLLWTNRNVNLVGKAFTVGNVPFVWVCRPSTKQTSFLLVDRFGNAVGRVDYGTALNDTTSAYLFNTGADANLKFHGCYNYRQRTAELEGIYHEGSTREFRLDFAPTTTSAQAGRCLYYSGMQLWQYDGSEIVEQGFHFYPEGTVFTPTVGAGSLTVSGQYFYLIYLCHKNALGEEVRSPAVLATVTLGATQNTVGIDIVTIPTLRKDTYFLIYRNVNTGTNWHLVSSRDPSSSLFCSNPVSTGSQVFTDLLSDAAIISRELDIGTSDNFLMPFSAPSCTVVSQGKNRLWLAGGEIPPGQVWPSRYYQEYETPAFHPGLALTLDRDNEQITAIGFLADLVAVFKKDRGYVIAGDGLNNTLVGSNFISQLALADTGSVGPNLGRTSDGLVYLSSAGYRLLTPSGESKAIGLDVDTEAIDCSAILVDTVNYNVRCYQSSGFSLVWDYYTGNWTNWTVNPTSGVFTPDGALLTVGNRVYRESEVYTDDSAWYEFSIRTAHIGKSLGGFQRVRRIVGLGESDRNYTITINFFLDEKDYPSQTSEFDSTTTLNTSVWGDGNWGDGFWGDAEGTGLFPRESVWKWTKRLNIQRCSCVSVEIVYNGPYKGPVHTALVFQLGKRNGLDRVIRG